MTQLGYICSHSFTWRAQISVLGEHRKFLWSDALWFYSLSLSSHTVFKENRGDQSFKIHNSTQMWRRKHPQNKVSFSQGWETAKGLQISRAFLPLLTSWLIKWILQIPCCKYGNSSSRFLPFLIPQSVCPQHLLIADWWLPQPRGRTYTWSCSAPWGSPGSTSPGSHRENWNSG